MKIKKLSVRITVHIVICTTIAMIVMSFLASYSLVNVMKNEAVVELSGVSESASSRLSALIQKEYAYLDGFMASQDMKALIDNPEDPDIQAAAQAYTQYYSSIIPDMKSMFYVEYQGKVLTHTLPEMIGYMNDPELIKMIQGLYYNDQGTTVYNSVTAVSPATSEISMIFARSSYNSSNKPAGYVSVEVDETEFYNLLESAIHVADNQDVVLTGVNNPVVYYSTDADEITLSSEKPIINSLIADISSGAVENEGFIDYIDTETGEKMLGYYTYLRDNDWLLLVGAQEKELYSNAYHYSNLIIFYGAVITVLIALILVFIISRLVKPITNIQTALTRVAAFDITDNKDIVKYEKRADEIGKLAVATRTVIISLKGAVSVFREYNDMLEKDSENLENASTRLSEVTSDNQTIADSLAYKINETNSAIESIRNEIDNILGLVSSVNDKVETGQKDSAELITSATKINDQINTEIDKNMSLLQETMASMETALDSLKAVEQINSLAEDIMSITSQTNLLSLNASIEAARAGEAGKGFAVVAGEIGQLAEQSKETAMNITEIVAASNESVTNVRNQVSALIDFIKNDVISSFEIFSSQSKHYDEGISTIEQSVSDIGSAMDSLNQSINEIAKQIKAVNDASAENTDGVSNILGKNVQATDVSKNIEEIAQNSKNNANDLKFAINQFKTE